RVFCVSDHLKKLSGHRSARIGHVRFLARARCAPSSNRGDGTNSVGLPGMRRYPIIILAFAAAATAAACETDLTPTIVRLGSVTTIATFPQESLLIVTPNRVILRVGQSTQLLINAPDTLLSQLVWRSELPTVASVNQAGVVTGGTPGTTIVTVRYAFDTTN